MTIIELHVALSALASEVGVSVLFNGHDLWNFRFCDLRSAGAAETVEAALEALHDDGEIFMRRGCESFVVRAA